MQRASCIIYYCYYHHWHTVTLYAWIAMSVVCSSSRLATSSISWKWQHHLSYQNKNVLRHMILIHFGVCEWAQELRYGKKLFCDKTSEYCRKCNHSLMAFEMQCSWAVAPKTPNSTLWHIIQTNTVPLFLQMHSLFTEYAHNAMWNGVHGSSSVLISSSSFCKEK